MTSYVRWALSQVRNKLSFVLLPSPDDYRDALCEYACEIVDGDVVRMTGKVGLPLGCPAYLEACMVWDRERRAA